MSRKRSDGLQSVVDAPALDPLSDTDLRGALVDLFDEVQRRVDANRADLVVLTARRLGCTYQLLLGVGLPRLRGCEVVSDRYLEATDPSSLAGRRVLVVDDSIVLGTTLHTLHARLVEMVKPDGHVSLLALCEDTEQRLDFLLADADLEVLVPCNTARVARFAYDLVVAFLAEQIPFVSDFPVTSAIDLADGALFRVLGAPAWLTADVTAPLLEDETVTTYSMIPTDDLLGRFLGGLPASIAMMVEGVKIRLFTRATGSGGHRVVVVPIALMGPARPSELDEAIEHLRPGDGLEAVAYSPGARHRLVQLFVACRALAQFWVVLADAEAEPLRSSMLDRVQAELYFGSFVDQAYAAFDRVVEGHVTVDDSSPLVAPAIRRLRPRPAPLLDRPQLVSLLWEQAVIIDGIDLPPEPSEGELTKIGFVFADAVASVFGFINAEFELPQRAELLKLRSLPEYTEWLASHERIINLGLTMPELRASLIPGCGNTTWCRALVSLGIDTGNDVGVIVPITQYDEANDIVYRAYRLGENASISDRPLSRNKVPESWDHFTRQGMMRRPLKSIVASVQPVPASTSDEPEAKDAADLLRRYRPDAMIVEQYKGEITDVEASNFRARLTDVEGGAATGAFPLALVARDQRGWVGLGARFAWTVYQDEQVGMRSSLLHLFAPVDPDWDTMLAVAAELGDLFDREQ